MSSAAMALGVDRTLCDMGAGAMTRTLAALDLPFVTFDRFGRVVDVSPAATRVVGPVPIAHLELGCQPAVMRAVKSHTHDHSATGERRNCGDMVCVLGLSVVIRVLPAGDERRVALGVITPAASPEPVGADLLEALTAREREVARLLASGASTKAIAHALGRSIHTVRRHTDRIFAKLGVGTRTQLANRLRR